MTILAGAFSRRPGDALPDALTRAITGAISRHPGDAVQVFRDDRCLLAKVDIGAYGEVAFRTSPLGSVAALAGEALLSRRESAARQSRTDDLETLHRTWDREDWAGLAATRGVFCAAHYAPASERLTLVADKLGLRPIYYWADARSVVFASALRILEAVDEVPKRMNLAAVTEIATLGFPLAERTPYADIRVLNAGERVGFTAQSETHARYWSWDSLAESQLSEPDLLEAAAQTFADAIARRLGDDRATVAFLTGGLDSRSIVGCLRARGATVHTFYFARLQGTQDQRFAALFADRVGTRHREMPFDPAVEPRYAHLMAQAWNAPASALDRPPERPKLVWSGDGGSVALGHVYMSRTIVDEMRAGHPDRAIAAFLSQHGGRVIRPLLTEPTARALNGFPADAIARELEDLKTRDPARRFHLFLMLNDQRRHLAGHFEDIDLHRLEFHLPFFDGRFLELVLSAPVDACLRHQLYGKWLAHLPSAVASVPWQAYPGHEPCPLPVPADLGYQWGEETQKTLAARRRRLSIGKARELLEATDFPGAILRKDRLRLAYWLLRTRLRDYGYAVNFADVYYRYWRRSRGAVELPTPHRPAPGAR